MSARCASASVTSRSQERTPRHSVRSSDSQRGLKRVFAVIPPGAGSLPTNPATATPVGCGISADGQTVSIRFYEESAGAAGSPLAEKNNAEAYIAGQSLRVLFIGY